MKSRLKMKKAQEKEEMTNLTFPKSISMGKEALIETLDRELCDGCKARIIESL